MHDDERGGGPSCAPHAMMSTSAIILPEGPGCLPWRTAADVQRRGGRSVRQLGRWLVRQACSLDALARMRGVAGVDLTQQSKRVSLGGPLCHTSGDFRAAQYDRPKPRGTSPTSHATQLSFYAALHLRSHHS